MKVIIKTTIKLLFRNVAFWFFLICTPVLSTFILKTEQTNLSAYELTGNNAQKIQELDGADDKVAYYGGKGFYVIKVYDASDSELSEYMLNHLTESGAFIICRAKTPGMTEADVAKRLETDGYNDKMGAVLYLTKDFDVEAVTGVMKNGMKCYILSDDARQELMKNELRMILGQIRTAAGTAQGRSVSDVLKGMNETLPSKQVESVGGKNSRNLTNKQIDERTLMGYAFAILTLGFVFAGIFVAHTAINEQKDMVLTRIKMTNLSNARYFTAKFLCGGIVSVMLTAVMGICTLAIPAEKLCMSRPEFLLMILALGLIFCSLSLLTGILLGNIMSANIAAFTVWSLSSLLAGMYFPLDATSDTVRTISYLMPQKWFVEVTEMIMTGDNKAYFMLLCVTAAYLIITLSLGSVGIKFKTNE